MLKEYEASGKTLDEALDNVSALAGRSLDELNIEVINMPSKGFLGIGHKDARVRATFEVPDAPAKPEEKPVKQTQGSTFGTKKTKKEKVEAKKAKIDFELTPIVSIDPNNIPEEVKREAAAKKDQQKPKKDRAPKAEKAENKGEGKKKDNNRNRDKKGVKGEVSRPKRESKATDVVEGEMADTIRTDVMNFLTPVFDYMGLKPELTSEVKDGILYFSFGGEKLGILIGRRGETLNALQYLANLAANKRRNDHVRIVLDVENYREGREETLEALAKKMADKAVRTGRRVELEPMNPHERRVVHIALQNDKRVDTVSHGEEPYRRVVISKRRHDRKPRRHNGQKPAAPQVEAPQATEE